MSTDRRWDLLALGNPCADLVVDVASPPRAGEKVLGRLRGRFAGGTTANAACALARLGGRAAVMGQVGDDDAGRQLRAAFETDGVDARHLATLPGRSTGLAIAMRPAGGDAALVVIPLIAEAMSETTLRAALSMSRVVLATPSDLTELRRLRQLAAETGTLVAIDIDPVVAADRGAVLARAALADIVLLNARALHGTGKGTAAHDTPDDALRALQDLRAALPSPPLLMAATRGARGAGAIDATAEIAEIASEDTIVKMADESGFPRDAVDTTGAGDTFNGALILAWLEGQPLREALRFACAAASLAVGAVGARTAMPDREATQRLAASDDAGPAPAT
ncbi:carbohydrate kinase family protein [Roseateles chitinivorans]|uniref:carbohydrate kinase family protein n=1 Tax=Roseateles chitinivorans TaxID=2917965 RepID=UPI003D66BA09